MAESITIETIAMPGKGGGVVTALRQLLQGLLPRITTATRAGNGEGTVAQGVDRILC